MVQDKESSTLWKSIFLSVTEKSGEWVRGAEKGRILTSGSEEEVGGGTEQEDKGDEQQSASQWQDQCAGEAGIIVFSLRWCVSVIFLGLWKNSDLSMLLWTHSFDW